MKKILLSLGLLLFAGQCWAWPVRNIIDTDGDLIAINSDGSLNISVSGGIVTVSSITAASVDGIRIQDDSDTLGIFIEDGGSVGVGTASPGTVLGTGFVGKSLHLQNLTDNAQLIIESSASAKTPILTMIDGNGAVNDRIAHIFVDNGLMGIRSLNDNNTNRISDILRIDMGDGRVGIRDASPDYGVDIATHCYVSGNLYGDGNKVITEYNYTIPISTPFAIGTNYAYPITPFRDYAITITTAEARVVGGTSVEFMLEQRAKSAITTSGTDVWSSSITATTSWVGGTFNDATVPADSALFFVLSAAASVSGDVDLLVITYTATKD